VRECPRLGQFGRVAARCAVASVGSGSCCAAAAPGLCVVGSHFLATELSFSAGQEKASLRSPVLPAAPRFFLLGPPRLRDAGVDCEAHGFE
ncbi:unnamed protein product, partial [Prorocentrum cordatum]